ncbi:uncharacterized protein LOC119772287 [Cyprinodon tularosa]|uniref:uncharacterized protein LOC119772287 n=1 Tax=Cyprinodon tularosa TaxID=77115 RepID=UPI0018E2046A|nr:uncharacterized protein LOC119772287 [Cyprinodon tularosa]
MERKTPPRKTLRTLFSRTDPDQVLDGSAQKEDRKRFKFPKLKIKSRKEAEALQEVRAAECRTGPEDGQAHRIVSVKKSSSVFAVEFRGKAKEFSYSELDLRKPKRFATFSFGLRRRKRRDEENLSKSAFGLHSSSTDMQEETPVSCLDLDQTRRKVQLSLSQPELDTSGTFDIPSPPPPSSNRSQASSSVSIGSPFTSQNGSESEGTPRAPIASIPELQLEDTASSEEPENLPGPADQMQTSSDVPRQAELVLQNCSPNISAPPQSPGSPRPREHHGGSVPSHPQTVVLTPAVCEEQRQNSAAPQSEAPEPPKELLIPESEPGSSVCSRRTSAEGSVSLTSAGASEPRRPSSSQDPVFGPFYEVTSFLLQPAALSPNGLPASQAEPVLEQNSSKHPTCLDSPAGYPGSGESGASCAPQVQVRGWSSEPTASCSHSRGLVPDPVASPVSGRSLGTGSRVSCSKRRVVLVRQSFAADSSPAELGMNFQEMISQSFCEPPGWTDGSDRTLSPAYLSLGSDEGSATEVYYSAPEEEEEEEEEGAQQPGGGLTAGTLRGGG